MPLGTLWIFDRRNRTFGEHERHVLQSIAAQIAGVLERVALLRGSERHQRIARELEHATRSQPVLLPNDLPADPRYELAAHVASCHELGGDLCEIIPLPQHQVGLAIGDASGHSISAALIMASVRGALRVLASEERSLPEFMRRLNEALYAITRSHQFMSLCFAQFDPGPRRLTYCNAGHPLPLLLRQGTILPLGSHGLLLGVIRDADYSFSTLDLQPGDLLVFYTDGISEARSGREQMFRADGVAAALVDSRHGTAQEVLTGIWNCVEHHLEGTSADDDRTLVVLRIR
jgi:sigma-B regulation protein RsbU (phosphoserine phosphatase)